MWRLTHLLLCLLLILGSGAVRGDAQAPAAPPYELEITRDLVYATVDRQDLKLDIYRPRGVGGPRPLVVAVHGGFWAFGEKTDMRPFAEALASQGYAVASVEYRLIPDVQYPAPVDDVRSALRWLAEHGDEHGVATDRVVLMGISAGAQLAALAALRPAAGEPAVAGMVSMSGPMDLTVAAPSTNARAVVHAYLGGAQADIPAVYREASPITHVAKGGAPWLILHGDKDTLVPPSQSLRMAAALKAVEVPATYVTLEGLAHEMPAPDAPAGIKARAAILAFVAGALAKQ
jgi:acetyl esterase/lipase